MADPKTKTTPSLETPKPAPAIPPDAMSIDVPPIRVSGSPRTDAAAPPALPDDVEAIRAQLVAAERERDALLAEKDAAQRAAEAKAEPEPIVERRVLGMIPIYSDDQPADVRARAAAVMAGHIPADKATRFRTDANVRAPKGSKLTERYRFGELVPIGTEFHRDEIDDATRAHWSASGSIVAIG